MKNKYQNLTERIQVPASLTDQVLLAAARQNTHTTQNGVNSMKKKNGSILRMALCAAAALVLITGAAMFAMTRPETIPDGLDTLAGQSGPVKPAQPATSTAQVFSLTAYAAGLGTQYPAGEDGSLAMGSGSGMYWLERDGFFTGSLFRVTGENIQTVSLSLDRGGLYSYRILHDLTAEQQQEIREAQGRNELAPASIDQDDNGVWSFQEMIPFENTLTVNYDQDMWYGLWKSGITFEDDPQKENQINIDAFDGGLLSVIVTFTDGTEQTNTYHLHTGKLRTAAGPDGSLIPLPELAGENESYIYGVYAVLEQ
ncbi:MAG: hypothetical protein K2O18_02615 [Oscillospiraceae bacterium]|nr:hypothetical protein [Oscillospiraceae bacterium]